MLCWIHQWRFAEYGPVYSVSVPQKAINDTLYDKNGRLVAAFAFIVMGTKEGAQKAYAACTMDEVCV